MVATSRALGTGIAALPVRLPRCCRGRHRDRRADRRPVRAQGRVPARRRGSPASPRRGSSRSAPSEPRSKQGSRAAAPQCAVAVGTVIGGPIGDRFGRKVVIWGSILGVLPFTDRDAEMVDQVEGEVRTEARHVEELREDQHQQDRGRGARRLRDPQSRRALVSRSPRRRRRPAQGRRARRRHPSNGPIAEPALPPTWNTDWARP
jgi:hypothetical protein